MWEIASLSERKTGFPFIIWISINIGQNDPRIKVTPSRKEFNKGFSVSISDNPEVVAGKVFIDNKMLKKVFEWILLNKGVLMQFWDNNLDTEDAIQGLVRVE